MEYGTRLVSFEIMHKAFNPFILINPQLLVNLDDVLCSLSNVGGKTNSASRFLTPRVYNGVWISWTLLVIGVTSYWAIRTTRIFISLGPVMLEVIDVLYKSAKSWNLHHSFENIPVGLLLQDSATLLQYRDRLTLSSFGWTGCWMAFGVVLLAVRLCLLALSCIS